MKTFIKSLSVILILVSFSSIRAEWKPQAGHSIPDGMITCVLSEQVRIALNAPYVFSTSDGGQTWNKDSIDVHPDRFTWVSYQHMQFTGEETGFIQVIVGDSNYVFRTTDAGKSWNRQWIAVAGKDSRIQFITAEQWIISVKKQLAVTSDGGVTLLNLQRPGNDTAYFYTGIISEDEWYLFSGNTSSAVNVYRTTDHGVHFETVTTLHLYNDSLNYIYPFFAGIAKTSKGLTLAFNIFYPGCGMYFHHAQIYTLEHSVHYWSVKESTENFDLPVTGFTFSNDTGYITTYDMIYKNANDGKGWIPVLKMNYYTEGMFQGLTYLNGAWLAWTSKGGLFKNEDPSTDRNLKTLAPKEESRMVRVYPNPASAQLTIDIADRDHLPLTLIITDVSGKEIWRKTFLDGESITLATNHLISGHYFYSLNNEQFQTKGQFIINH